MTSSKTSGLKTRLAMAVLAATVLTAALLAQSERGTITWTVQDATGAVVPEAKVTLTNTQTSVNFTIPTNASGDYTVPQLQVGVYSVKFEKEGFRPATVSGIVLNASMTARADAKLEVGAAAQAIEVSADAISIATENAKMSVTANNKLVDELPLVVGGAMRSPFNLASLTPEAKEIGGVRGFILGGGQAAGYGTSLDGVSANTTRALQSDWVATNAPSVEAVTEFTVDTNEFKAEFGQASGGIMSFASKSGTNDYHGSAYDFARNEAFDANNFFNNGRGIARAAYKQHDFGASFGGSTWIPKIYNGKNRTFFFWSYEAFRNWNGPNGFVSTVPTSEMYDGDFRNWVNQNGAVLPIYDPTSQRVGANNVVTRAPFSNNVIPKSLFDPTVQKALAAFRSGPTPLPNTGAAPGTFGYVTNNYIRSNGGQTSPNTKISGKFLPRSARQHLRQYDALQPEIPRLPQLQREPFAGQDVLGARARSPGFPRRDVQRVQPSAFWARLNDHSVADIRHSPPNSGRSDKLATANAVGAENVFDMTVRRLRRSGSTPLGRLSEDLVRHDLEVRRQFIHIVRANLGKRTGYP